MTADPLGNFWFNIEGLYSQVFGSIPVFEILVIILLLVIVWLLWKRRNETRKKE